MADIVAPPAKEECIRVVVRCRPLNSKELADGRKKIVEMNLKTGQVVLNNPKQDANEPPKSFTFDAVFDETNTQTQVYDNTARTIVDNVLSGYNGTVFAYGQTGTGKTHSMEGKEDPPSMRGITPNSFEHIFGTISSSKGMEYLVRASFLEIYNEEIRDLLGKDAKAKLDLKENKDGGVYVKGLNAFVVKSADELRNVLNVGKANRSVGATLMNDQSSRSHCIFSVTVEMIEQGVNSDGHIRVGKLNLVDLAGSERQGKTGATGDRLKEATKINLSLSALGNVISALVDSKNGHIPYRDSKLTRMLQDSLGGNTKTVMVANVGPADWNYDETLSTLRYANRAKNIKNKPRINEDPKDAMLREFQDEIGRLKAALAAAESGKPLDMSLFGGKTVIEEDDAPAEEETRIVEKVVEVARQIEQKEVDQMRIEMEKKLQTELRAKGVKLDQEQLAKVKAEAEAAAKAEAKRIEAERKKAELEKKKAQESIAQSQAEVANKAKDAEQIKREKEELAKKLKAMEAKIVKGDEHGGLLEVTKKKEEELRRREEELERKRREEEENKRKIAELEEAQLAAEGKYTSKQEEVNQKTAKLKKLYRKFQEVNGEVEDLYREFQREKEDLLDSIRLLNHQMRLKDMVIDAFIPPEEAQKVMKRAQWDEEREVWVLERLTDIGKRDGGIIRRPISAASARRPTSDFAKLAAAMGDLNPRFKSDNILSLELDMPERTTFDYAGPNMDPRVQAAIATAFADGDRLLITS